MRGLGPPQRPPGSSRVYRRSRSRSGCVCREWQAGFAQARDRRGGILRARCARCKELGKCVRLLLSALLRRESESRRGSRLSESLALQLRTMDHLARIAMKNAANCVKYGEMQGYRNRNMSNAYCGPVIHLTGPHLSEGLLNFANISSSVHHHA